MQERSGTFPRRLLLAGANTLSDPRLLWALVVLFTLRRIQAEIPVFMPPGADVFAFLDAGHRALTDPGAIYPGAASAIAQGFVFVTLYPPPQLLIAAVYALLPGSIGPIAWVATNAAASAAALVIMFRHLGRKKDWALPVFCLLTICFTPLFEDIRLGQRGGLIMLLGVGAMVMVLRHPILAGLAGGAATSLKFYPGAMLLGAGPKRNWKFWTSLVGCSFALLAATFFPFGSPLLYVTGVLLPSLRWQSSGPHDCFQNSTQLLFARVVGGEPYSLIDQAGAWRQETFVPWHYPQLATVLTYLTIAAIVVAMLWAVRRSGGAQPYSLALGFSLGTIVPGEVFTYQFLPMLPLLLIVFMKGIELRQIGVIVTLSAALWVLLVSPCALPLPSAWTVAALTIFGVAVWQAPAYRRLDRVRPDPVAAQTIPSSQRASSDMRSGVHTGS